MINKLTKPQEKKITTIRDEWINRFFSCKTKTNRKQATKYINWLYELSGLKKPMIIFLDSPLGVQYGANMLKKIGGDQGDQIGSQIESQVESQIGSQVRSQVWSQVWSQIGSQIESQVVSQVRSQVRSQVWSQVESQVWSQIGSQVWSQVWSQIGSQVRSQVESQVVSQVESQVESQVWSQVVSQVERQVRSQVERQKLEVFSFASYGSVWDYGWVAFYEYFKEIGVKFNPDLLERFNNFVFLLKSGIYDMVQLEGVCIVSGMPTVINRDAENRLHSKDSPAIKFADGYKEYFYHGMAVPEKWILHPEKLKKADWSNEQNLEKRRVIQELMGDTFPKKIGSKLIAKPSKEYKAKHNLLGLYEVTLPNDPENTAHYIRVKDHSTKREYYLRTDPKIKDADEALAWSFGLTKETYNPIQET